MKEHIVHDLYYDYRHMLSELNLLYSLTATEDFMDSLHDATQFAVELMLLADKQIFDNILKALETARLIHEGTANLSEWKLAFNEVVASMRRQLRQESPFQGFIDFIPPELSLEDEDEGKANGGFYDLEDSVVSVTITRPDPEARAKAWEEFKRGGDIKLDLEEPWEIPNELVGGINELVERLAGKDFIIYEEDLEKCDMEQTIENIRKFLTP